MRRIIAVFIFVVCLFGVVPAASADNIGAAGDISNPAGGFRGDVATAALLAPQSGNGIGLVLPLGDSQYQCGELANYRAAYDLSWGRYLGITRPAPGNHEYITGTICQQPNGTMRLMTAQEAAGAGYYQYFKDRTRRIRGTTPTTGRAGTSSSSTPPARSSRAAAAAPSSPG